MPNFTNVSLGLNVDVVELKQRHAVRYWEELQSEANDGVTGPAQWQAILDAAAIAEWFVDEDGKSKKIDTLDFTPAQARWLAEELATHLLEQTQIPNA